MDIDMNVLSILIPVALVIVLFLIALLVMHFKFDRIYKRMNRFKTSEQLYVDYKLMSCEHDIEKEQKKALRDDVAENKWLDKDEFLHKVNGLFREDSPGCYVILFFADGNYPKEDFSNYDEVYVGQSVHVIKRLYTHLQLKSHETLRNKIADAYAKNMQVYVSTCRCPASQMNDLEKTLIWAFDAADSFNSNRGGSQNRDVIRSWSHKADSFHHALQNLYYCDCLERTLDDERF